MFRSRLALLALPLAVSFGPAACTVDTVGLEACRDIEYARCEARAHCGEDTGLHVADVDACKRFYRDQCLHGLDREESPSDLAVKRCVNAIKSAGTCAAQGGGDAPLSSCTFTPALPATTLETACGLLGQPELSPPCSFLSKEPLPDAGGSGGTAGAGGSAGSSGTAGTAGTSDAGGD